MPKTEIKSDQVLNGGITRDDLNITTSGQAVIRRILSGNTVTLSSSTGVDSGTGDVTLDTAQDLRTSASPSFVKLTLGSSVSSYGKCIAAEGDGTSGTYFWDNAIISVADSTNMAANVGGGIVFEGEYITANTSLAAFGAIFGVKANATSNNTAGKLVLWARGGDISFGTSASPTKASYGEVFLIGAGGSIGIGTSTLTGKLNFAASTGLYDGINFGNEINLYRSASWFVTMTGTFVATVGIVVGVQTSTNGYIKLYNAADIYSINLVNTSLTPTSDVWLQLPVVNGTLIGTGNLTDITNATGISTATAAILTSAGGIGYRTGAGGTQTQGTSKTTAFTLSKLCGNITFAASALGANTTTTGATWTNTLIAATDNVVFQHISGGTLGAYRVFCNPGAGSATIYIRNITGGSLSESPVFRFTIIKGVTA